MRSGELFRCGREMTARDADGTERSFRGFLEPLGAESARTAVHSRAGTVSSERFRLIAEPKESFPDGAETRVLCGGTEYRVLAVKEFYTGFELSHRECVLRKAESGA